MRAAATTILTLAALATPAIAGDDVTARLTAGYAYAGSVIGVSVEVGEVEGEVEGLVLVVPEGFRVAGPDWRGNSVSVTPSGRRSVDQYVFRIEVPAGASGSYEIGPLRVVKKSGKGFEIPVGSIEVGRQPETGVTMEARVVPPSGPVGMPVTVEYRILYSGRPHEGRNVFGEAQRPFGLTSLSFAVLGAKGVKVESRPGPDGTRSRGVTLRDGTRLDIVGGQVRRDGDLYRTIDIRLAVTPLVTGEIDLSASAGVSLVTATEKKRDFFGRTMEVPKVEERRARTGAVTYTVADLPAFGRPKGFAGAVGRFTIEAVPKVREVSAFDPIEVEVTVRGEGALERVALPRWSQFEEIAGEFEIDADVDPGVVEGDAKVFKAVFRARSSAVTSFPALPFPYYDPWAGRYEVARSRALPITVRDVRTVRPEEAVGAPVSASDESRRAISRSLGIGANFEALGESGGTLAPSPPLLTPGFVALLLVPPLLALLLTVLDVRRSRPRDVRRGTPLSRGLAALGSGGTAESAAEALAAYFRERVGLGDGELTTAEIERALTARSVDPEVVGRVASAHAALVAARFAGGAGAPEGLDGILEEVDRCLG